MVQDKWVSWQEALSILGNKWSAVSIDGQKWLVIENIYGVFTKMVRVYNGDEHPLAQKDKVIINKIKK